MLPNIDGIEVLRTLRSDLNTKKLPVIMLSAKSEEFDKVLGLEMGADDYMTKPFSVRELVARVKVIFRRVKEDKNVLNIIRVKDLVIDTQKREVKKEDKELQLTYKEFELIKLLALNIGIVLSRDTILDKIWGYSYYGETRTVDVHVRHIRQLIGDEGQYIETVRGVGYKFKE